MTLLPDSARRFLAAYVLCLAAHAHGAPLPDTSFGFAGSVRTGVPGAFDRIDSIVIDPGGRILLVGFSDTNAGRDYLLSRLQPDGALDTSYGLSGRLSPREEPS